MVKFTLDNGKEIYLNHLLSYQLDTLIYNLKSDWDFVILVTGDRMVRTGKSVLAMNMAAYLGWRLKTGFDLHKNIFFDSQKMIDAAQELPKNSVLLYDEGRESLAASKHANKLQHDILDYFAECGQLNHIFIIVLPDFFELKETMAVARSEFLLNVYRRAEEKEMDIYNEGKKLPIVVFRRGHFEFFSRAKKALLYDRSKSAKQKNYSLVKSNFIGNFTNNYPVDQDEYRKIKAEALARFKEKKESEPVRKTDIVRDKIILDLHMNKTSTADISKIMEEKYSYPIHTRSINRIIQKYRKEMILRTVSGDGIR